jgi:hypothetical protein
MWVLEPFVLLGDVADMRWLPCRPIYRRLRGNVLAKGSSWVVFNVVESVFLLPVSIIFAAQNRTL